MAHGPDAEFEVRADVGGPEAEQWSDAKVIWRGVGVDAVLLRTNRSFGDWPLPRFRPDAEDGEWESAGYAAIADDTEQRNRKTLPLHGSFSLSRGQGDHELALVTVQQVASGRVDRWKGISGAPVFLKDDGGLLGLVTDALSSTTNVLVGLPIDRLLDDIHFRTALQPSFLGDLPEEPWCLVITQEGGSDELRQQVATMLSGFRDSDPELVVLQLEPRELSVLDALSSVESWAASVEAMAKATVVVADVTGFQPGAMLLLGLRSVLRRGVTINVTGAPIASHASNAPFNVQETKVLSYAERGFYQDLRRAMSEGLANVRGDANYLDLPSYHAVRSPRPPSWVVDDAKSALVLCPFGESYSQFYDQKLNDIIQGYTGNKDPIRMLDIRSPRLVGQSLYEQIRWSTYCLIDWTAWRANVSFELGVRLASSEHDPLIVAQERLDEDPTLEPLEQHRLLQGLLGMHVYDPGNPYEVLPQALRTWSRPDRRPDEPIATVAKLRAYYESMMDAADQNGGSNQLVVNTVGGFDDVWSGSQVGNLTYCVSNDFGSLKSTIVNAMAGGAALWEGASSAIDFVYDSSQDANCTTSNDTVLFPVEPIETDEYIARAFFPSSADFEMNILVDDSVTSSGWDPSNILGHELGHTLGFRHEHTRPEAGTCFEDNNWRPLTPYDSASIMHYPQCNGTSPDLSFSPLDAQGVASLYGS